MTLSRLLVADADLLEVLLVERRLQGEEQHVIQSLVAVSFAFFILEHWVRSMKIADPALEAVTTQRILLGVVLPELNLHVLDFVPGYDISHVEQLVQRA